MKTARERAEAVWSGGQEGAMIDAIERHIREAMRDQRHLCAEAVNASFDEYSGRAADGDFSVDAAHAAVMNAPEPGK